MFHLHGKDLDFNKLNEILAMKNEQTMKITKGVSFAGLPD